MPPKGKAGTTPHKRAHGEAPTPKRKPITKENKPDVADEDAAFPRGGADMLTKQERQEIEAQARAELEREELEGGGSAAGPKRKKQKKGQEEDGVDLEGSFLKSSAVAGKVPQYVELLKFKKLVVGMRMWGMVLEVTPKGLQISLPDGLRGTVALEEACDLLHKKPKDGAGAQHAPLTSLFSVGQFVRCAVVGLQQGKGQGGRGGKMVELSCRLRRVIAPGTLDRSTLVPGVALPSEVKAELDHGWTLSFGHKGFEGFLPRAQHQAAFGEGATLAVGQLQEVVVQSAPDARGVVSVSTHPGAVADALTSEGAGLSLESLLPGALVNARVRRVQGDGLLVTFLTFFHGTVDPFHLHLPGRSSTKPGEAGTTKGFTEGMKLKARILYVNPTSKEVGLSLLPHLIDMTLPSPVPLMGQVFENARVLRVDNGLGVMLELPQEGSDSCKGYCHISNLSDERLPKLDAVYKVGNAVRCRVIGFNLMDGLAHMSARKAVVEQQVLSYNDVVPGMTISGKLYSVDDPLGLWVSVAKNVRALVPALHLPDASSAQKARAKFKVDQNVTGRVLAVDPAAKKMSITLKPGLLTSKLPPIVSLDQAVPGVKTHAVVTGVKDDKGVFLSFYGNVTSLAPTAELGLPTGAVPSAYFHPGQVVRARVTSLDSLGRPRCSLKAGKGAPGAEAAAPANGAAAHGRALQVGDVVDSAVVKAVVEAGAAATAGTQPRGGALLLDIPSAPGVPARLDLRGHLSDHPAAEAVLRPLLAKQGAQLGPLVVLERLEGSGGAAGTLILSRKPSLVKAAAAGILPRNFEEVKEGALLQGFVANVTHDSVFVRFAGHTTGRAGLSQLADSFVADPRQLFTEGQSVRTQVVTVDAAHKRFSVTLRPSLTSGSDAGYLASMFSDLELAERLRAQQALSGAKPDAPSDIVDWSLLRLGSMVPCEVSDHAPYGMVVDLDVNEDLVGVIRPPHYPGAPAPAARKSKAGNSALPVPGTKLSCRVLDVSQAEGIVDLSARADLTSPANQQQAPTPTPSKRKKGAKGDAEAGSEGGSCGGVVSEGQWPCPPGSVQEAVVEVVQGPPAHYAVVSLPQLPGVPLAYVALTDFNAPTLESAHRAAGIKVGEHLKVVVAAAPEPSTGGRLLAVLPSLSGGSKSPASVSGDAIKQSVRPGSVVSVRVAGVGSAQADVVVGKKLAGRVHVSQARDMHVPEGGLAAGAAYEAAGGSGKKRKKSGSTAGENGAGSDAAGGGVLHLWHGNPLDGLAVGQQMEAVVLGRGGAGNHGVLELSIKPSVLEAAKKGLHVPPQPSFGSLQPGMHVGCVVSETADDHAWLSLSASVRGRLHVLDSDAEPQQVAAFGQRFKVGDGLVARVVSVDPKKQLLDLTLLPPMHGASRLVPAAAVTAAVPAGAAAVAAALPVGSLAMGRLSRLQGGLRVQLGGRLHGTVALSDVHDVYVANALEGLQEGSFVRARVLSCAAEGGGSAGGEGSKLPRVTLSLRPLDGGAVPEAAVQAAARAAKEGASAAPPVLPQDQMTAAGATVSGYVKKVEAKQGMFVTLDRSHDARVKMCNLSDGFIEDPVAAFPEGLLVSGRLVAAASGATDEGKAAGQQRLEMTLRSAGSSSRAAAGLRVLSEFREGEVVAGRVKRVEKFGVFVELEGSNVVGLAHISELLDSGKVKNIHGLYRQNQIVRAKVVSIDLGAARMSLTLKPSEVGGAQAGTEDEPASKRQKREAGLDDEMAEAEDSEDGPQGGLRRNLGAGSSDSGSEQEEGSDDDGEDDDEKDAEMGSQRRAAAGDGHGGVDDIDDSDSEEGGSDDDEGGEQEGASGDDDDDDGDGGLSQSESLGLGSSEGVDGGEGQDSGSEEEEDEEEEALGARRESARAASSSGLTELQQHDGESDAAGSGWGPGLQLAEEQQADAAKEDDQDGKASKMSRSAKKRAREEREEAIERAEKARLQGDSTPSSPAEFEVLLRSSPNSSYVWIRYMAFLLGLGEADKARAVAQRALETIYYREEGEKFNVWVALLNLEAAHGLPTPDEALMATFSKAAPYCDQKRLYFALLGILRRPSPNPGRHELLSSTLRTMTKKFSGSAKVWLAAHEATLTGATHETGSPDPGAARKLLDRALTSLPKRKHIKVIVQTAMHEFKCPGGSAERGRGVLESVLRNHPKRIDLWSLYIDQEVKAGDEGRTRALFERITSLPLPPRKMKPIFKRWLNWEKGGSDPKRVDYVKQRAMEFVEATTK